MTKVTTVMFGDTAAHITATRGTILGCSDDVVVSRGITRPYRVEAAKPGENPLTPASFLW